MLLWHVFQNKTKQELGRYFYVVMLYITYVSIGIVPSIICEALESIV
jgi:hypothetical protein